MAKILQVEPTPNPMSYKATVDQTLATGNGRHYAKKEDAWDNPVATKIFDIHGVQSVFFMENFVTVTKTPAGIRDFIFFRLQEILMEARDIVPVKGDGDESKPLAEIKPSDYQQMSHEEKLKTINQVIDATIRPGLARDGGGLEIIELVENVLRVKYQGACGSCPSSTSATLHYISSMLQNRVSPDLMVQIG
ncbi:MAG: NifU family protein [Deltaproteobacteria bacterium]|nr:MAG: NifU family protein [Deltaproteobacteria bacterium]